MTPLEFINKWRTVALTERSAAQQHFLDLCVLLGHPTPAEADPSGDWFTFERGAAKIGGGQGWADVWKRGYFGWEYKGKHKDLTTAYRQVLDYREALENPPLLVVCDMDRFVIHTNFTATVPVVHEIRLADLALPSKLAVLEAVFREPEKLRPGATSEGITTEAARRLGEIAQSMRARGQDPAKVAHFLDRIVFCLFAEDIGLLPANVFTRMVERTRRDPSRFSSRVQTLFEAMAHGGDFGNDEIRYFNGNLFNDEPVLDLTSEELERIHLASRLDWSTVDPSIFGTLFERGMDPAKRSQLGAHYTSREDIETLVEPVVMAPLRREWSEVQATVDSLLATGKKAGGAGAAPRPMSVSQKRKARDEAYQAMRRFHERLGQVKVLDPACGSGNFLYVTLQKLKDLEKDVVEFALQRDFTAFFPLVGPWQLYGIEVNPYAYDLAQMTVWIGYLQWMKQHGYLVTDNPILRSMSNFQCKDAILDLSDPENPTEPEWPRVDYIIGNPPFLGDKKMRAELGDRYVELLRSFYDGRVPGGADLCCYWFERGREAIVQGRAGRAGLLATNSIRTGANQKVLQRISSTGAIFFAESDRPWVLDGAAVRVSMVGFDDRSETEKSLDRVRVERISTGLSRSTDLTAANPITANRMTAFIGDCKKGAFDISLERALSLLQLSGNPHGLPNSDTIVPLANASDVVGRPRGEWIIDFGVSMRIEDAARYEMPFDLVFRNVKPVREKVRSSLERKNWWLHGRPAPDMRKAIWHLPRYLVTPTVSKHRIFAWLSTPVLPAHRLVAFGRSDDYFFGVVHSRAHEIWSLGRGSWMGVGNDPVYTPSTCFDSFPLPPPTAGSAAAIDSAAEELNRLRENWLNPPEWTREEFLTFPGSVDGHWARYVHDPDARGIGTVRYPRLVPKDAECAAKLKARTLTNLYNQRPAWLDMLHRRLDEAVFCAYGWDPSISDDELLERLLALNLERAGEPQQGNQPL